MSKIEVGLVLCPDKYCSAGMGKPHRLHLLEIEVVWKDVIMPYVVFTFSCPGYRKKTYTVMMDLTPKIYLDNGTFQTMCQEKRQ